MFTQVIAGHRSPAVLLLGLLALLLWGQCSFNMNGTSAPRREFGVGIVHPDSLTTVAPGKVATLYLALELVNDTHRPLVVRAAQGQLQFNGQQWPWAFAAANKADGVVVPARARRQIQLAVPLVPADSLRQLQEGLAIGSQYNNSLRLVVEVSYAGKHAAGAPNRLHLYRYLQSLSPPK